MHRYELLLPAICIALQIPIVVFVTLWGTWRKFPFFSWYLIFCLLREIVTSATFSNPDAYYYFFWISEPWEIVLSILAMLESFWAVFRSFRLLHWFRFVLPAAIATALAYSAWQ